MNETPIRLYYELDLLIRVGVVIIRMTLTYTISIVAFLSIIYYRLISVLKCLNVTSTPKQIKRVEKDHNIRVITKLPNSEQSYKGKVKTHNYINKQNSQQPKNCENRNDPDLVQAFLKKWWVESDFKAPNIPACFRCILFI